VTYSGSRPSPAWGKGVANQRGGGIGGYNDSDFELSTAGHRKSPTSEPEDMRSRSPAAKKNDDVGGKSPGPNATGAGDGSKGESGQVRNVGRIKGAESGGP